MYCHCDQFFRRLLMNHWLYLLNDTTGPTYHHEKKTNQNNGIEVIFNQWMNIQYIYVRNLTLLDMYCIYSLILSKE